MQSETEKRPLLSFCIAAYRRTDTTLELVNEILSVEDNRFEVVICDNHSEDGGVLEYKKIKDSRLKVYENEENLGGYVNSCRALDCGIGEYLFYINDRDNVDSYKIERLLSCFEHISWNHIAFGMCPLGGYTEREDTVIFEEGESAILEFACRVAHPTGYFFRRNLWEKTERHRFFESQDYGIYAFTIVCALLARDYKGAYLYGDVCDWHRHRLDFARVTSKFNQKIADKSLWYSPEAMLRELKVLLRFMKEYDFAPEITKKCFMERYKEYLALVTTGLKVELKEDYNTLHYKIRRPKSNFEVCVHALQNGRDLKKEVRKLLREYSFPDYEKEVNAINQANREEMRKYLIDEILDSVSGLNYRWPKEAETGGLHALKRGYRYEG